MSADYTQFHDEAAAEYDAAFEWYLERSPDAALKFDAEVERAFTEVVQSPRRWAVGSHGTRRFLLRQFPFILIYRERPVGKIEVLAVAHTSRKPGYWIGRL
jgi:toxin ParE1/3/4